MKNQLINAINYIANLEIDIDTYFYDINQDRSRTRFQGSYNALIVQKLLADEFEFDIDRNGFTQLFKIIDDGCTIKVVLT
jgi:hypothetical protein